MEKTNLEYMAEPARVERTLQKFMKMTLYELKAVQQRNRPFAEWCMDGVIDIESLDREKAEKMCYTDMICFLYNISTDGRYAGTRSGDGTAYPSEVCQNFAYKMLMRLLLDVQMRSIPVRLFISLPLKAFYDCLAKISGDTSLFKEYRIIHYHYVKLEKLSPVEMAPAEKATIKDVLKLCDRIFCMAWSPTQMALETYRENMMQAYNVLEWLLVKSFRLTFPQQFCLDRVRTKYTMKQETA